MTAILIVGLVALYFAPAIIALRRKCRSDAAIFVFNLLLGWTVFGWFVALAWALGGRIRGSIWPAEVSATPPLGSVGYENETNERGERCVWLAPNVVDRLRAMRGPGESYSDVILRLAKGVSGDGPSP